ncbi:MAG: hypothetical protein CL609_06240 [Anaerolineaceae bacterium]|nr:hypothetical protein [Anaerolineaceae bacterium]
MDQFGEAQSDKLITPFQRLQNDLAHVIADTAAGQKLPSEPKLAKQLGVSRATLREAMRSFEGQGVIRRRQGVGTFVVGPGQVFETGLEILESIETLAEKMKIDVKMGELVVEKIEANEKYAKKLGVALKTPLVSVSRVILTEERPVAFLIDVLPESVLASEDLKAGFSGSVLDRLIESKNYSLSKSKTIIHAVAASSSIARSLEIQRGDVLLYFEASLYDEEGSVIDYSHSYFLPGYFRFQVMRSIGGTFKL